MAQRPQNEVLINYSAIILEKYMAQITVHRALTQLKTLDGQINKATTQGVFVAMTKGDKKLVTTAAVRTLTAEAVTTKIKADYQSAKDLIVQRNKIKSAIVASNAVTKVTVAGVEMTVAEAIERKSSIQYECSLLQTLKSQFQRTSAEFEKQQQAVDREIAEKQSQAVGREVNAKINDEDAAALTRMVETREKPALVDPLAIDGEIQKLEKEITEFLAEVDSALNESNAVTRIEV